MDTRILGANVTFVDQPFITPLQLSSGTIRDITEARVEVTVRVDDREAVGRGNILLSDLWAWPDKALPHDIRDGHMRELCRRIADHLPALCGDEPAHPLELGLRLHDSLHARNGESAAEAMPILAAAVCASPFDAAIHDATGTALGLSAFRFYDHDTPFPEVDGCFGEGGACRAIRDLIRPPCVALPAWWIIGAHDVLEQSVLPIVREYGFHCFKLKLLAKDNGEDIRRTVEVFRTLASFGITNVRLSADTNEANPDAASVLDFLVGLRKADEAAFSALEYLEQPTARDVGGHAFDWAEVARLKPVLLDEGLTGFDILPVALEQGWSGLALKTCKGHSFALVAAAWAHAHGMLLSLQDLTNPGYSGIHAALFAAHVPTINGVEMNSPQFIPDANAAWLPRLRDLFYPSNGCHQLGNPDTVGLGSTL